MAYLPFDWYEHPRYYDIVFDIETAREADFLESVQQRFDPRRGRRWLEPACGSGRLVAALARRGHELTGFDASEGMVRFARRRLAQRRLAARIDVGRMESFAYPERFDLAYCLVDTFRYLHDERSARAALRCAARSLRPGGLLVIGLHLSDYADRHRRRERWVASRGSTHVTCNIQSWPAERRARRERLRSRLIVDEGGRERRLETHWNFRTYSAAELSALLLSVDELEHRATYTFDYDVDRPAPADGRRLDVIPVLQRGRRSARGLRP